jgi:hypothetical protein
MLSQFIWNVKSRAVVSAVEAEVDSLPRGNWAGNGFTVNSSPVSRIPLVILDSQENILEEAQTPSCCGLTLAPSPPPISFGGLQCTEKKDSEFGKKEMWTHTDKEENQIFLKYKEILNGGVANNI